jgi:hypothetical protein
VLTVFYQVHAPENIGKIDSYLAKYEGREVILFAKIAMKYGINISEFGVSSRDHLVAILQEVDPSKVDKVDVIIDRIRDHKLPSERVVLELVSKYPSFRPDDYGLINPTDGSDGHVGGWLFEDLREPATASRTASAATSPGSVIARWPNSCSWIRPKHGGQRPRWSSNRRFWRHSAERSAAARSHRTHRTRRGGPGQFRRQHPPEWSPQERPDLGAGRSV